MRKVLDTQTHKLGGQEVSFRYFVTVYVKKSVLACVYVCECLHVCVFSFILNKVLEFL